MPFLLVGFMFQLRMMMTDMLSFKKSLEKSSKTAVEAINNIRTVAGLRCEERVIGEYARALQGRNSMALTLLRSFLQICKFSEQFMINILINSGASK